MMSPTLSMIAVASTSSIHTRRTDIRDRTKLIRSCRGFQLQKNSWSLNEEVSVLRSWQSLSRLKHLVYVRNPKVHNNPNSVLRAYRVWPIYSKCIWQIYVDCMQICRLLHRILVFLNSEMSENFRSPNYIIISALLCITRVALGLLSQKSFTVCVLTLGWRSTIEIKKLPSVWNGLHLI